MPVKYLHSQILKSVVDGKVVVKEESVIHGDKGLTIKLYNKENDKIVKIIVVNKDGKYIMKTKKGDKEDTKELSKEELLKELKGNENLNFALDYVKKAKDLSRPKANSRKDSRKSLRKDSRKSYRK